MRMPWRSLTLPSTGSVYAKSSAYCTGRLPRPSAGSAGSLPRRSRINPSARSESIPS